MATIYLHPTIAWHHDCAEIIAQLEQATGIMPVLSGAGGDFCRFVPAQQGERIIRVRDYIESEGL